MMSCFQVSDVNFKKRQENGIATLENGLVVPQNIKHRVTL